MPPASRTIFVTSSMLLSNSPSVLGSVIISPASSSSTDPRRASRSVLPSASEGSVTTSNPAMAADAGLVPWAESGISTFRRCDSPTLYVVRAGHQHPGQARHPHRP